MKKLLAVLCVAALLVTAVPAFANPSIQGLEIKNIEAEITADDVSEETQEKLDSGWTVQAVPITEDTIEKLYSNKAVREVITAVNINTDPEQSVTVADVAEKLETETEKGSEGVTAVKVANSDKTVDLNEYSFVTGFIDFVLTDGEEAVQSGADETLTVTTVMTIPQMKGVKGEDLEDYLLMLVNSESAEVVLLEMDPEQFDSKKDLFYFRLFLSFFNRGDLTRNSINPTKEI